MKYIKTYENSNKNYTIQSFVDIPYWRYRNSKVDTIMKVEFYDNNENNFYSDWKFTTMDINTYEFFELIYKNDFLYQILQLEDPEKILRPANKKEIEKFNLALQTNKYNL